jgi:sarcosine oxidase
MASSHIPTVYDAVIVGLGGVGSATLYHLAKKGLNVLGLEQFTIAHELGSSHGQTRIIRGAYHEGVLPPLGVRAMPCTALLDFCKRSHQYSRQTSQVNLPTGQQYVPLLKRSWHLFEALQESTGISCLHQTGCLAVGSELVKDCQSASDTHALEYTLLNPQEVLERFPGYHVHEPVREQLDSVQLTG